MSGSGLVKFVSPFMVHAITLLLVKPYLEDVTGRFSHLMTCRGKLTVLSWSNLVLNAAIMSDFFSPFTAMINGKPNFSRYRSLRSVNVLCSSAVRASRPADACSSVLCFVKRLAALACQPDQGAPTMSPVFAVHWPHEIPGKMRCAILLRCREPGQVPT